MLNEIEILQDVLYLCFMLNNINCISNINVVNKINK